MCKIRIEAAEVRFTMHLSPKQYTALEQLATSNINLSDLILSILGLHQDEFTALSSNVIRDLVTNLYTILDAFKMHSMFAAWTRQWIHDCATNDILEEVQMLTRRSTGWHGYATRAQVNQIESISARGMAGTAKAIAPRLWSLFDRILMDNRGSHAEDPPLNDMRTDGAPLDFDEDDPSHPTHTDTMERKIALRELVRSLFFSGFTSELT